MAEQNNNEVRFFLWILPVTLASEFASRAREALLSPSTAVRMAWEVTRVASKRVVYWVASK